MPERSSLARRGDTRRSGRRGQHRFMAPVDDGTSTFPKMVLPLYQYPSFSGSDWDTLSVNYPDNPVYLSGVRGPDVAASIANRVEGYFVIANPATGPGASENTDYTAALTDAVFAGYGILGYVNTMDVGAGNIRLLADVTDDIDAWFTIYGGAGVDIAGIFFDLLPTGLNGDQTGFVQDITDHVRTHDALLPKVVVGNFGTWPLAGGYITPLDIACTNEDTFASYMAGTDPPGYAAGYAGDFPPDRLLHLVHGVTDINEAQQAYEHAWAQGAGWFYAADTDGLWGNLATYWAQLDDLSVTL